MTFCAFPQSNEKDWEQELLCRSMSHKIHHLLLPSHPCPNPVEPFLWSISSCHWLPLFWLHLAHSKNTTEQNPRAANPTSGCSPHQQLPHPHPHYQTMTHVPLLSPLGKKLEGPKQRFKQKPANWDKDAKFELLFKENDLWEYMKLNHPFLKPTDKVHSQNHLLRAWKKECLAWHLLAKL